MHPFPTLPLAHPGGGAGGGVGGGVGGGGGGEAHDRAQNGVLVDEPTPEALADGIHTLLSNATLRRAIGKGD